MARRQIEVSDEILEHISSVIEEYTSQIDCRKHDRMVEIDENTGETIPLTARIEERYTPFHRLYYAETTAE